jgi:hypothetical protein
MIHMLVLDLERDHAFQSHGMANVRNYLFAAPATSSIQLRNLRHDAFAASSASHAKARFVAARGSGTIKSF